MTPADLARGIHTLQESVMLALNKAGIGIGTDGHIKDFPTHGSPKYRVFMSVLVRQPDNLAQQLLHDIRHSERPPWFGNSTLKLSRHNQEFLARQHDQSNEVKRNAAERFRQQRLDNALKRALRLVHNEEVHLDRQPPDG